MEGFLTVCFSDWTKDYFSRGVMRIINGRRTDQPIRRNLKINEKEGVDYYIKTDPDFENFSYSRCHKKLRQQIKCGDLLFFRTLWRGKHYFIGYFLIKEKRGNPENPICLADKNQSLLLPNFIVPITPAVVKKLNPKAVFLKSRNLNLQINEWLGRNYLKLDQKKTAYLKNFLERKLKRAF